MVGYLSYFFDIEKFTDRIMVISYKTWSQFQIEIRNNIAKYHKITDRSTVWMKYFLEYKTENIVKIQIFI